MFFFILGIVVNTFYALVFGSLIAGCVWVCRQLARDVMSS